jgi:hypothetical protein
MTQLEKTLLSQGWDSEKIYDTIIKTKTEMMEAFFIPEGFYVFFTKTKTIDKMNKIMEENLGFVCEIDELFALYDELVERSYPSEKYYKEREKEMKQIANW